MIGRATLGVVLAATVARAGTPVDRPEAFEVDRDTPPPGRVELGFDGGAPVGAWTLGLQLGYLDRPLRLHGAGVETFPVDHRETVALGGAVAIGPSIVLDARLPLGHQVGDRFTALGDAGHLDRWVLGDLGIGARVHVATRGRIGVFVRGHATFGTGDDHDFAGEARYTAAWLLIARATLPRGVVVGATAGIRLRGAEVRIADRLVGDELLAGIGAAVELPPVARMWCHPDQVRLTGELVAVVGDRVAGQRGPSPAEARLGVIGKPRPWLAIGVRIGTHLDDQIGAPRFRAMLELAYEGAPPVKPRAPTSTTAEDSDEP